MIQKISIEDYFNLEGNIPLIDIRTPLEYQKGHIPDAINLPIFSNEERVKIGTTYKKVGREQAILLGFDVVGTKWRGFIEASLKIAPNKKICVHCWRGGMRSGAMAWALDFYGFEVYTIIGGYKSYRNWVLQQFEKPYPIIILGGKTGSHKTTILQEIQMLGEQVIDLEGLAQHQGSAFGSRNIPQTISQEQFENKLMHQLRKMDLSKKIWIEDESVVIGNIGIPRFFWYQMQAAKVINLEIDLETRVAFLLETYGILDKDFLISATEHIRKRLGPLQTKNAIAAIQENRMEDFIRTVLVYYDKGYLRCIQKRNPETVFTLTLNYSDTKTVAEKIIEFSKDMN